MTDLKEGAAPSAGMDIGPSRGWGSGHYLKTAEGAEGGESAAGHTDMSLQKLLSESLAPLGDPSGGAISCL